MAMNLLATVLFAAALAPQAATTTTTPQTPSQTTAAPAPSGQPPAAQSTTPTKAAVPDNYVIGPQDQLSITVFGEESLTGKYRVENDGFFNFPFLERVRAAGRTLSDLQAEMTKLLADGFFRNPQVRVEIDQYKSQTIFVTGEVRNPNEYTMTGSSMSLLQALAMAGSPTANASNEVIISRQPTTPGAEMEIIKFDRRALELGRVGYDVTLKDGDVINVPKAQTFFISGFVRNPGTYVLDPGLTVEQALALAGGLTERGSDRRLTASRMVKGKQTDVDVRLEDTVQPGDTIKVPSRFF
jgi:polysaccharide export outer membrane protein